MFLEITVPMVLNCLKAESIPSCNHGCNKTTLSYHLHPVKFSVNENRIGLFIVLLQVIQDGYESVC